MAGTHGESIELVDRLEQFLNERYRDEIAKLAQRYPNDQRSLAIDWRELHSFDMDIADDYIQRPEGKGLIHDYLKEALAQLDFPVDVPFHNAHIRVHNLLDEETFYPNEFSPTDVAGTYRTIVGDVLVSTEVYPKMTEAQFDCQRCGTPTVVPITDDFQEPYECQGCERQGPFEINFEESEFIDGQTIQLQTPPERATGTGRTIQVFVEDDICGTVQMGDRIAVSGILRLQQKGGDEKTPQFETYFEGRHIEMREASSSSIEVDAETRERVEALADGEAGDPLQAAAETFAPGVHGRLEEKKALVLAIVGGATQTPGVRGQFHVLLIGDPSTGKSKLIMRVPDIAARSVSVSSSDATSAGLTSTATQGDFSQGRWMLQPGAFVKANEGVVVIDELDDMDKDDRASMAEPMANQQINVSKGGINATLATQTSVVAAANPVDSRFDPYEPLAQQFGFEGNMISRFDLVFTFHDTPDEEQDKELADHVTQFIDTKIREGRGMELSDEQAEMAETPVDEETLRVWLSLARQQPDPVYASEDVRESLADGFVTLRGANGYDEDAEVPVTHRKLRGVERVARAAAKLELSPVIEERHAEAAMSLVGKSMQDYQKTEDGTLDADIAETGQSKSQREQMKLVRKAINEVASEHDGAAPYDEIVEWLDGTLDEDRLNGVLDTMMHKEGSVIEPSTDHYRYVGRA